jgi:hypothetical protein
MFILSNASNNCTLENYYYQLKGREEMEFLLLPFTGK